ncbi:MAG: DUF2752 domain-containing protein [Bacteroidota bacterium]
MGSIVHWLENHLMPCPYKHYLGIDCPGCGMQRSIIELLKGNLWESIVTYPPLIPMAIMIIYLFLHLFFKFKRGAQIVKYMFIFVAIIVTINYISKLLIHH